MRTGIYLLAIFSFFVATTQAEVRTWTDSTGNHRIYAEFIEAVNSKVRLKKVDGSIVSVPLNRLSSGDRRFVADEIERRKNPQSTPVSLPTKANVSEGSWPQWRGKNRDGISSETGLLQSWSGQGPKIAWQTDGLGKGYASISISGEKIFSMGKFDGQEHLMALDVRDGSQLWATPIGRGKHSNCTPTVDGNLVYAVGLQGDLLCADVNTGKEIWRKNYAQDFGGRMMSHWGFSESPLVDGDRLICTPGSDKAMIAALDKKTGKIIWTTPMPAGGDRGKDGAAYSSIVISQAGGVRQYVQLVGRGVIGVDADKGRLLWRYDRVVNTTANIPTPIIRGDYVFCSTGYRSGGSALLKLSRSGSRFKVNEVYYRSAEQMQNHHGGMILIGDYIYMGHGHNNGFPLCFNMMTGREAWRPGRGPGSGSAAVAYADGHLYFRYEDATMALIEANPDSYVLKGTFKIASRNGKSWPHPVIADGKLYLRDQNELHCYDIAAQ